MITKSTARHIGLLLALVFAAGMALQGGVTLMKWLAPIPPIEVIHTEAADKAQGKQSEG